MRVTRIATAVALVLLIAAAGPTRAAAFEEEHHESATREALPFMAPGVVAEIVRGNLSQDHGFFDPKRPTHHFDSCFFSGSTRYIRNGYADLVSGLDPDSRPKALARAHHLGRVLHPMQDFYAHSNWWEHGRTDLLDARLGPWRVLSGWKTIRDDLVVGQGEHLPRGWRKRNGPPRSRVWTDDDESRRVIITGYGRGGVFVDDDCHDDLDFSHEQLNKDGRRLVGFAEARALAVRQTQHEWCRLLRLSREKSGEAGPSALLGLWVSPGASPHPFGSPCASRRGPIGWRVRVAAIRANDPKDGAAPGQLNFRAALYGRDLRGSSIAGIGPVSVAPGQAVPEDRLPGPLTLCTSDRRPPVVTVQGWDDDGDGEGQTGVLATLGLPDLGGFLDVDDVLDGVTVSIRRPGRVTDHRSKDLTATFVVERLTGALSPCAPGQQLPGA